MFLASERDGVTRREAIAFLPLPDSTVDAMLHRLVSEGQLTFVKESTFSDGKKRDRLARVYRAVHPVHQSASGLMCQRGKCPTNAKNGKKDAKLNIEKRITLRELLYSTHCNQRI